MSSCVGAQLGVKSLSCGWDELSDGALASVVVVVVVVVCTMPCGKWECRSSDQTSEAGAQVRRPLRGTFPARECSFKEVSSVTSYPEVQPLPRSFLNLVLGESVVVVTLRRDGFGAVGTNVHPSNGDLLKGGTTSNLPIAHAPAPRRGQPYRRPHAVRRSAPGHTSVGASPTLRPHIGPQLVKRLHAAAPAGVVDLRLHDVVMALRNYPVAETSSGQRTNQAFAGCQGHVLGSCDRLRRSPPRSSPGRRSSQHGKMAAPTKLSRLSGRLAQACHQPFPRPLLAVSWKRLKPGVHTRWESNLPGRGTGDTARRSRANCRRLPSGRPPDLIGVSPAVGCGNS